MKIEVSIEELLRWRLKQAEADAPDVPRAARLLEEARPWWEVWPGRFREAIDRLSFIQIEAGHAMADLEQSRSAFPVPTLVIRGPEELEASARIHCARIEDGRLRLRFELEGLNGPTDPGYEITFVAEKSAEPLFCARAGRSGPNEYGVDSEIPAELAGVWKKVKITDRLPFRLILHTDKRR